MTHSRPRDQKIQRADGPTLFLQLDANARGRDRCIGIECYTVDVRQSFLQLTPAARWQFRAERSVLQLVKSDGGNRQLAPRGRSLP